jgi:hypothetical protein
MRDRVLNHFNENMAPRKLFVVDCDWEELWNIYLNGFPAELNPMFRERRMLDCSECRSFFKRMANVVAIDEDTGEYITLFEGETGLEKEVFDELDERVKSAEIKDVFMSDTKRIGVESNREILEDGSLQTWYHFYADVPERCVGNLSEKAILRNNRIVLENSTQRISEDAVDTVLELIASNSLYRGDQWEDVLKTFKDYLKEYDANEWDENVFYWVKSIELGSLLVRIKNHSIGVLLMDVTQGVPLDEAVTNYERIVAPTNYQRPKPIFTKRMLEEAQEKINELGFGESIYRRYANMADLSINDVLFANRDYTRDIQDNNNLFDKLRNMTVNKARNFDKVQEIALDDFIEYILPTAVEVELYLSYDLSNNFMSLIAPVNMDAPSMFKWDNPFSWAYKNNIADSLMKERVKALGGDVDVDLRFTIQWNDNEWDKNDLDAHCTTPEGEEIYYSHMKSSSTKGWLDVDIIHPEKNKPAVENIQFKDRHQMVPGQYRFRVHQYTYRGGDNGFKAEIEFDGKVFNFNYPMRLAQDEYVNVARVIVDEDYNFKMESFLDNQTSSVNEWNLNYNSFVPVSLICYSPNYWGDNAVGNKHVFFILKDCLNDGRPNPWFNEYLVSELRDHRKVTEALATIAKVEESDEQLSGIGFSFTQKNKVTLKVKSENIERVFNVVIG